MSLTLHHHPPVADPWAARIRAQLGKSVEAIIDVGNLLVQAKASLDHGEWGRMFEAELVPFTVRTAERLMAVSEHPQLSNATHASDLPPSWTTLYELTKVDPKRLAAAFKDGTITQQMQRGDVRALLPVEPPAPEDPGSPGALTDVKTEHCDVRVDPILLRVLQFVADRHAQTVADFVRLGLWSFIHESMSEQQVRVVVDGFAADPKISNKELERRII